MKGTREENAYLQLSPMEELVAEKRGPIIALGSIIMQSYSQVLPPPDFAIR